MTKDKRSDLWAIIAVVIALLAFIFGDNIYERITGRSVFGNSTVVIPSPTIFPTPTTVQLSIPPSTQSPSEITDDFGVLMRLVPAGNFIMGSNNSDNEQPIHDVYLNAFYIDEFEVTSERYVEFLNDVISEVTVESNEYVRYKGTVLSLCSTCDSGVYAKFKRINWDGSNFSVIPPYSDHPITLVTWYGARNFCEWRGARLPTEAEWEKAAHGIDNRTYPWGDTIDCTKSNYTESCVGNTSPVGSYDNDVSPYGVYDMAGNAWEWVADWYSDTYYQNSPLENPLGPDTGLNRVLRGGSFLLDSNYARSTFRLSNPPDIFDIPEGFRCVKDITQSAFNKIPSTQTSKSMSFLVVATSNWYDTGIVLDANQTATIEVVNGEWTIDRSNYPLVDGNGYVENTDTPASFCINSCDAPSIDTLVGTLVARVDDTIVVIGNHKEVSTINGGRLFLMINDLYDALDDNSGYLKIRVIINE